MMSLRFSFRRWSVIFLLVVSACAPGTPASAGPVRVEITADEFSFQSSLTTFQVGTPYRFVVTDTGEVPHEFMLMAPVETGQMSMEALDEMALAHIEEEDLQAGATATLDYTFTEPAPSGQLEFACHLAGHYEAGMKLPIEVK